MTWLVTGGAGYIGAHVARALSDDGADLVVLDDLSTGRRHRVHPKARYVEGSLSDRAAVDEALEGVTGVVHIAAKLQVGESVEEPLLYYRDNVGGLVTLLEGCRDHGVRQFLFSSSAATYGTPSTSLVTEDSQTSPINPYGETKLVSEWLLRDCARAWGLQVSSLRYFNVAGAAAPDLGDLRTMHLIPLALKAIALSQRPKVFGTDYPTPDGTCIRDYVHVADLADAHVVASRALEDGRTGTFNVGRGHGASVLEVLRTVAEVTGHDTAYDVVDRRAGDPAELVASVDRIRDELGWTAQRDLRDMVASAWEAWQHEAPPL
jgi:UDP-glucose 4-epimerase